MEVADMDIDMDIDLGPIDVVEAVQPPFDHIVQNNGTKNVEITEMSVVDPENTTPHKIHIRGVDDLTTGDIQTFAIENFPSESPTRIEWIDDTSANIVYKTPGTGLTALDQLSHQPPPNMPIAELRAAKPLSTHPEATLHIRIAFTSDQKKPRAHEASRFYMMHPEHDPREQRRQDRSHHGNGEYRRRRYGDDENKRRRRRDKEQGFDASMYDDQNAPSSEERSLASSPDRRSRAYRDGDTGERNRSASPERRNGSNRGRRNRTPPPAYRIKDPHPFPIENEGKELFPTKSKPSDEKSRKDLFSNKLLAGSLKKELFPQKANTILHRRSDAFDAADETADLFASGMTVPFADNAKRGATKSLASRITAPSESTFGRLRESDSKPSTDIDDKDDDVGLNIRGASQKDQGFSIRGSAAGTIRELFPGKSMGNAGKELFAEKLEGRGARRTRAEDMFY